MKDEMMEEMKDEMMYMTEGKEEMMEEMIE